MTAGNEPRAEGVSDRIAEEVVEGWPGNPAGAPIGGLKVQTAQGWFAARPSGTENVYKVYAESFRGTEHLERILDEATAVVSAALEAAG